MLCSGLLLFFLQVLLHPNSGAAGKDGAIEALRLAQYKAFYTTGRLALVQIILPGKKLLRFLFPCSTGKNQSGFMQAGANPARSAWVPTCVRSAGLAPEASQPGTGTWAARAGPWWEGATTDW